MADDPMVFDGKTGEIIEGSNVDIHPVVVDTTNYKMAIGPAKANLEALREYVRQEFKEDVDFGPAFPGDSKKSLRLPGAEKFNLLFSARPRFVTIKEVTDFQTGFCLYHLGCELVNKQTGMVIGYGEGSCNSYESKFRYRNAERLCPVCKKNAIIKGKAEYGGGFLCFGKKGGCGAKFADDDPEIVNQEVGRVESDNLFDVWNTVLKQAEKRAMVASVVYTGGVSELFTQDEDDYADNEAAKPKKVVPKPTQKQPVSRQAEPDMPVDDYPEQEQVKVRMTTIWDGKTVKPAEEKVDQSTALKFINKFVNGADSKLPPAHFKNHVHSHFGVEYDLKDTLPQIVTKLTWEQLTAMVKHLKGEGDTMPWYPAKDTPKESPVVTPVVEKIDGNPDGVTTDLDEIANKVYGVKFYELSDAAKQSIEGAVKIVYDSGKPDDMATMITLAQMDKKA